MPPPMVREKTRLLPTGGGDVRQHLGRSHNPDYDCGANKIIDYDYGVPRKGDYDYSYSSITRKILEFLYGV